MIRFTRFALIFGSVDATPPGPKYKSQPTKDDKTNISINEVPEYADLFEFKFTHNGVQHIVSPVSRDSVIKVTNVINSLFERQVYDGAGGGTSGAMASTMIQKKYDKFHKNQDWKYVDKAETTLNRFFVSPFELTWLEYWMRHIAQVSNYSAEKLEHFFVVQRLRDLTEQPNNDKVKELINFYNWNFFGVGRKSSRCKHFWGHYGENALAAEETKTNLQADWSFYLKVVLAMKKGHEQKKEMWRGIADGIFTLRR